MVRSSERTNYGSYVTYTNETTGVRVSLVPRDGGIFIDLSRLVDGEVLAEPIFIEPDTPLNSFDLDNVLILRSAPAERLLDTASAFTTNDIERKLDRYANALREYASDILWGDFGLFSQLDSLVRNRKRKLDNLYE
jgi:hypothetical protein